MKRILIRADASPAMGTGHVMRCLALALAAQARGCDVLLAGRVEVGWVAERVRAEIAFQPLSGPVPNFENATELEVFAKAQKPDAVILDGYHFGLDCQKAIRAAGFRLLMIDDYQHLPEYSADILLNQNLGAEELDYQGDIALKLTGPKYALLRPEFAAARKAAERRACPEQPERLLLTLGGGDFSAHLERLAPAFNLPQLAGMTLNVLAGRMSSEKVKVALANCPGRVNILHGVDDMPGLLLESDLAVTAGGSTCWELCCLGVPFLTVKVAENQQIVVRELARREVAPAFEPSSFQALLNLGEKRRQQRERGLALVPPSGAVELAASLEKLIAR